MKTSVNSQTQSEFVNPPPISTTFSTPKASPSSPSNVPNSNPFINENISSPVNSFIFTPFNNDNIANETAERARAIKRRIGNISDSDRMHIHNEEPILATALVLKRKYVKKHPVRNERDEVRHMISNDMDVVGLRKGVKITKKKKINQLIGVFGFRNIPPSCILKPILIKS